MQTKQASECAAHAWPVTNLFQFQGWRQKFSNRGAGASDKWAKMTGKGCLRALFCQISSDENQNFVRRGGGRDGSDGGL